MTSTVRPEEGLPIYYRPGQWRKEAPGAPATPEGAVIPTCVIIPRKNRPRIQPRKDAQFYL